MCTYAIGPADCNQCNGSHSHWYRHEMYEVDRPPEAFGPTAWVRVLFKVTVGFHNFNLRIFNLRVSNPNKLIVDVFLTRCRISMCQGLGPKKHDEISEIDRAVVWPPPN